MCFESTPATARPVTARAGDIVVFSSLTPHTTGPNRCQGVRKAYIVQYAPDGACVVTKHHSGALERHPAAHPERQFAILRHGREAAPQPAA